MWIHSRRQSKSAQALSSMSFDGQIFAVCQFQTVLALVTFWGKGTEEVFTLAASHHPFFSTTLLCHMIFYRTVVALFKPSSPMCELIAITGLTGITNLSKAQEVLLNYSQYHHLTILCSYTSLNLHSFIMLGKKETEVFRFFLYKNFKPKFIFK